jgi:hypothetical protein
MFQISYIKDSFYMCLFIIKLNLVIIACTFIIIYIVIYIYIIIYVQYIKNLIIKKTNIRYLFSCDIILTCNLSLSTFLHALYQLHEALRVA